MRRILLSTLITLATVTPAFATEPAQTAFDLLSKYSAETKTADYIKLQSSTPIGEAKALDAKFSDLYGAPSVTRAGLKVWEVDNSAAAANQSAFTTIMCGPDGQGGLYISADRRGPNSRDTAQTTARPTQLAAPKNIRRAAQQLPVSRGYQSNAVD